MLILGINGSPHKNGLGAKILADALGQCEKDGAETKLINLVDQEKYFFNGELSKEVPQGMEQLFKLIEKADGIIFSTPVHWFSASALMKNFIDQLTVFETNNFGLEGKVAGFIASAEEDGGMQAILPMAGALNHMGMLVPPYCMFFYNKNMVEKSESDWMETDIKLLGHNLVKLCKAVSTTGEWGYDY